ncbi:hypothetical protein C7402_11293 [Paraburkholderia unamae]|uniref:Uncharacterized protein n=1 Tax=Paraburkholderia unamae TaxID=219649 RepID=A0ABX5KHI1_9BURK|nr:hypothetical protein [Paraburkholderia unamae]PVX79906.1 hypothetical protein C7402_11293 [Paraburkholderia unamae]RAR54901.1 hypothetical protein C7401_12335 [Paraburkholderia unamae]CAG9271199.1 conserved exported hypothetical protein [Paraburkholderia unamae]
MKRYRILLACLVCLAMSAVSGLAAAGDMNRNADSASSTSGNSSGGGY